MRESSRLEKLIVLSSGAAPRTPSLFPLPTLDHMRRCLAAHSKGLGIVTPGGMTPEMFVQVVAPFGYRGAVDQRTRDERERAIDAVVAAWPADVRDAVSKDRILRYAAAAVLDSYSADWWRSAYRPVQTAVRIVHGCNVRFGDIDAIHQIVQFGLPYRGDAGSALENMKLIVEAHRARPDAMSAVLREPIEAARHVAAVLASASPETAACCAADADTMEQFDAVFREGYERMADHLEELATAGAAHPLTQADKLYEERKTSLIAALDADLLAASVPSFTEARNAILAAFLPDHFAGGHDEATNRRASYHRRKTETTIPRGRPAKE